MHCGIEFEYIITDADGQILDFTNTPYGTFKEIIGPDIPGGNDDSLTHGDLGIKQGYWYLEADERFDEQGKFVDASVKGVEIRTPIARYPHDALASLAAIEKQLAEQLARHGYNLGIIGYNPIRSDFILDPPLNAWEQKMRSEHHEWEAPEVYMLSYGPDINVSFDDWTDEQCLDAVQRLTYYSPFITPFSFSSPFFGGKLWDGLSKRTYERTWRRAAARTFVENQLDVQPAITYKPSIPSEHGRIEFKAFDAITSPKLLEALCSLVIGICQSSGLHEKSQVPDKNLHQLAAREGFANDQIFAGSKHVLQSAKSALQDFDESLVPSLALLEGMLEMRTTPADDMIKTYNETGKMVLRGGLFHED